MKAEALPKTDSIQEWAQFWDTHDLTDFENELMDGSNRASIRASYGDLS